MVAERRVRVRMMKSEGQKGQHADRSPQKVCECFFPLRAVMMYLCRCCADVRVDEDGVWAGPRAFGSTTAFSNAKELLLCGLGRLGGRHAPLRCVTEGRHLFAPAMEQIEEKNL